MWLFDVNFDLNRKARLVEGFHLTDLSTTDIYYGIVAIDSVQIGIFLVVVSAGVTG